LLEDPRYHALVRAYYEKVAKNVGAELTLNEAAPLLEEGEPLRVAAGGGFAA
jgi:hypothetical protein